jgi:uncharacterized protein (TIGR03435 family)
MDIGPALWSVQGYDLRTLLARVYDLDPAQVHLEQSRGNLKPTRAELSLSSFVKSATQAQEAAPRFDVSLSLNGDESDEAIQAMLQAALEQRFHLSARIEARDAEVYVLTAPSGAGHNLQATQTGHLSRVSAAGVHSSEATEPAGEITVQGRVCPGISSAGISGRGVTLDRLAAALEDTLDRPVIDETHLAATYDFNLPEYRNVDQLKSLLRDQLGVSLKAEHRTVDVLAVHPAQPPTGLLQAGL